MTEYQKKIIDQWRLPVSQALSEAMSRHPINPSTGTIAEIIKQQWTDRQRAFSGMDTRYQKVQSKDWKPEDGELERELEDQRRNFEHSRGWEKRHEPLPDLTQDDVERAIESIRQRKLKSWAEGRETTARKAAELLLLLSATAGSAAEESEILKDVKIAREIEGTRRLLEEATRRLRRLSLPAEEEQGQ